MDIVSVQVLTFSLEFLVHQSVYILFKQLNLCMNLKFIFQKAHNHANNSNLESAFFSFEIFRWQRGNIMKLEI